MADPTNYIIGQANPTPFASLQQGYALGQGIRQDQQAQQVQQIQIQQMQNLMQARAQVAGNPNASANDYARLMTLDPSTAEATQKAWTTKNTAQQQTQASNLLQWGSALINGQPQVAADQMTAQADAMEAANGGQPTQDSQALRTHAQVVVAHPEFALGQIYAMLGANPNGKQAADTLSSLADVAKKNGTLSSDISSAQSDAEIKRIDAVVKGGTMAADIAKPALENGKIAADTNLTNTTAGINTAEFQRKPGAVDLPASALDIINKSGDEAANATTAAAQSTDLANQIDTAQPGAFAGGLKEGLKSLTGNQDYVTSLRQEYVRLRASEVMKSLPPGSASDTDVKQAMAGFPSETAAPATISSFLRGLAKLQTYQAQYSNAKSQWVNQVGSLGMPGKDINIDGTTVPAGTTFAGYAKAKLKPVGAQTQPPAPAGGTAAALIAKYGGGAPAAAPAFVPVNGNAADTAGTD